MNEISLTHSLIVYVVLASSTCYVVIMCMGIHQTAIPIFGVRETREWKC